MTLIPNDPKDSSSVETPLKVIWEIQPRDDALELLARACQIILKEILPEQGGDCASEER
jgi:hypothetical protein